MLRSNGVLYTASSRAKALVAYSGSRDFTSRLSSSYLLIKQTLETGERIARFLFLLFR